jgi:hypothetical protein
MEPGTGERPTTLAGNSRYKTDDWTVSLAPQADGTTRADIHYAGLPDLGAQPVTTVTGATPEEAQTNQAHRAHHTSDLRGETKEARQVVEELREAIEHVQSTSPASGTGTPAPRSAPRSCPGP